jgi:phosphopantothenoylcysteine decarboxylase
MSHPPRKPRLLVGVTGSVAAVKWEALCLALQPHFDLRVVLTARAEHFHPEAYAPEAHAAWGALLAGAAATAAATTAAGAPAAAPPAASPLPAPECPLAVLRDADEWARYAAVGRDPVLHIELRKWADGLLVAPCSAHTLAKLAGGLADNLLTCAARAWEFGAGGRVARPLLLAPAMNTAMWRHPATAAHLGVLRGWGATVVPPVEKVLACGDVGVGAMAEVADIVAACRAAVVAVAAAGGAAAGAAGAAGAEAAGAAGAAGAAEASGEEAEEERLPLPRAAGGGGGEGSAAAGQ